VSANKIDDAASILQTYTDPIPDELIKAFEGGRCVLFAFIGDYSRLYKYCES
jgi:hypothetical protein